MHQLRCSGILEVVRMKQQGYPIRMPFEKFYEEYEILGHMQGWAPAADCSEEEAKVSFESVLSCLGLAWLGLACLVLSWLVLSCLVLSCLVLSCVAISVQDFLENLALVANRVTYAPFR